MGKNFRIVGERQELGFKVFLNKKGTVIAKTGQAEVEISIGGKVTKQYTSSRNFIVNPEMTARFRDIPEDYNS